LKALRLASLIEQMALDGKPWHEYDWHYDAPPKVSTGAFA
jgi:hypothetical protein